MKFDSLIVGHIEWIARLAFRFHSHRADAEDLAQETLCRIYANRDKFKDSRDFKPWAMTVMANLFKTQMARRQRVTFTILDDYCIEVISPIMADERMKLRDVISAVRQSARQSIGVECVLLYAKGYTYSEIAEIVGITPGTVKSRISAARNLIRKACELTLIDIR